MGQERQWPWRTGGSRRPLAHTGICGLMAHHTQDNFFVTYGSIFFDVPLMCVCVCVCVRVRVCVRLCVCMYVRVDKYGSNLFDTPLANFFYARL